MKLILSTAAVICSLGVLAAQAPQAPPVTPMKFAHYPAAELKALATTLKSGGQITWKRLHRGDHDFQGMSFRAKSAGAPELHNNWTDLYYILDGEVNHHTGGKLEGGDRAQPRFRGIRRRKAGRCVRRAAWRGRHCLLRSRCSALVGGRARQVGDLHDDQDSEAAESAERDCQPGRQHAAADADAVRPLQGSRPEDVRRYAQAR